MSEIADKIQKWGRRDVTRWLERRNLAKFGPLFSRNGIVGSDLVQSRLTFLYKEEVTVEDRERLLAELYLLLHPGPGETQGRELGSESLSGSGSGSGSTAALTPSISVPMPLTPQDQMKYHAVLQVANSLPGAEVATPIVVVSPRRARPPPASAAAAVSATTLNLLASKTRSKSETRLQTTEVRLASPSPGRKYLKRKSTPAVHDYLQRGIVHNSSLFDTLFDDGHVNLHCVRVQRSEAGARFGFSYQTMADSCMLVTGVTSPDVPLQPGDRLLEVNGILLPKHDHSSLDNVLGKSAVLNLVVLRPQLGDPEGTSSTGGPAVRDPHQAHEKAVMQEVRWQALRHLLKQLQHTAFDPMSLTGQLRHVEDLEDIKDRARLETELEEAQRVNTQLWNKINSLQAILKNKEDDLERTREEKVQSLTALRSCLVRQMSRRIPSNSIPSATLPDSKVGDSRNGESASPDIPQTEPKPEVADDSEEDEDLEVMFTLQAEADLARLERPEVTKAEVLQALWEHSRASQRHVRLVDRLISLVAERAPWMLAELEQLEELEEDEDLTEVSELPEALQDVPGDSGPSDSAQSRPAEGGSGGCAGEVSADTPLDADGGGGGGGDEGGRGGQPCWPSPPARGSSPSPKVELRERISPRVGDHPHSHPNHHHQQQQQQLQQEQQRPVHSKAVSWLPEGSRESADQQRTRQQPAVKRLPQQQQVGTLGPEATRSSTAKAKAAEVTPAAHKVMAASGLAPASSVRPRGSATSPGSLVPPPLTIEVGAGGESGVLLSSSNAPCSSPRSPRSPRSPSHASARRFSTPPEAEENDLDHEQAILV